MRRRLIIEVEEGDHVNVGKADVGTMFSAGRARLMAGRLVVDFAGSAAVCQVVGEALGLQVVTDREQVLADAIKALGVHVGQSAYGAVCAALHQAGFE